MAGKFEPVVFRSSKAITENQREKARVRSASRKAPKNLASATGGGERHIPTDREKQKKWPFSISRKSTIQGRDEVEETKSWPCVGNGPASTRRQKKKKVGVNYGNQKKHNHSQRRVDKMEKSPGTSEETKGPTSQEEPKKVVKKKKVEQLHRKDKITRQGGQKKQRRSKEPK